MIAETRRGREGHGESSWQPLRINVRNLIRDFLEMYPTEPEEVVLTESIANSLDAGANTIRIGLSEVERHGGDQGRVLYSIEDDGKGMTEAAFEDSYHGIALSTKEKGDSIGFAGVGAKLYLAMLDSGHSVYTETRSDSFYGASEFTMVDDQAVWRKVEPRGRLRFETGTYVELELRGRLDRSRVEEVIRESYAAILEGFYGKKSIYVNWKSDRLRPQIAPTSDYFTRSFSIGGRKRCQAHFWLVEDDLDPPRGLDIVVLGKKVRGGEWFNLQFETKPEFSRRIVGMVTADPLASLLTTNKQDLKAGNDRLWQEFRAKAYFAFRRWLRSINAVQTLSRVRAADAVLTTQVTRTVNELLRLPTFEAYGPWAEDPWSRDSWAPSYLSKKDGEGQDRARMSANRDHAQVVAAGSAWRSVSSVDRKKEASGISAGVANRQDEGRVRIRLVNRPSNSEESWVDAEGIVINSGHPVFKRNQRAGRAAEVSHMMRCVFMALMENRDPEKKKILDELRRFYQGWASVH